MSDDTARGRILQTAGPIFAEKGFRDATVRDISEQAGVNLASINYYFGDKARMYTEVIKFARESQDVAHPFAGRPFPEDPREQLFVFIKTLLNRLGVHDNANWQTRLLVREFMSPGDATRQLVEEYFRPYFSRLLDLLESLSPVPLTEAEKIRAGFSVIGQCLHYRVAAPIIDMFVEPNSMAADFGIDALARHITDFSAGAIANLKTAELAGKPV